MRNHIAINTVSFIVVAVVAFISTSAILPDRITTQHNAEYITVSSLKERVEQSPIILIGKVKAVGNVVNMARKAEDNTQADPYTFVVGQSYTIDVERYLKGKHLEQGKAPKTFNILQPEGMVTSSGQPLAVTQADIDQARSEYQYIPMQLGGRYLFFLSDLPELGANPAYVTGLGYPWRFAVPLNGMAVAESPATEANNAFPKLKSNDLIKQVHELIKAQK